MFEREIQFIYDFNSNKVKKIGNFIYIEQLKKIDIHPAILQYIIGEIDFLVFEDRQKLLKDSVFDYSIPSVSIHFKEIGEEVKRNKKFSINYIDKLIQHSSSFIVSYLCKPNWSLMKFIFDDDKEKSTAEVSQILNYLYYYPHIKKVLIGYFEKKKIKVIHPAEFKDLLDKISVAGLETNYPRIIDEAIDSICDFFNSGVFKKDVVPLKAVEYFLLDNKLDFQNKKLASNYNEELTTKVNANEVKDFLKKILMQKTEYIDENEDSTSEKFEIVQPNNEFNENQQKENRVNLDSNEKMFGEELETDSSDEPNSAPEAENQIFKEKVKDDNIQLEEETLQQFDINIDTSIEKNDGVISFEDSPQSSSKEIIQDNSSDSISNEEIINEQAYSKKIEAESENEMDLFADNFQKDKIIENENPIKNVKDNNFDISEILNDKKMSKILDVIFDYDVEDFSNTIEKVCKFKTQEEAFVFIDEICLKANLSSDSKEAKIFKSVISKFYS